MNRSISPVGREIDLRALRYFVAAAEELHFSRAASRLFVAQQALSREIARLERQLGTPLFTRTTRRVALTPAGERLLVRARALLELHDSMWAELVLAPRTVVIDVLSDGRRTAVRVVEAVRDARSDVEFRATYGGGMGKALSRLTAGEVDIAFGRLDWQGRGDVDVITAMLVRLEPLALLLPIGHVLAEAPAIRLGELRDLEIDVNLDDPSSPEWTDLARQFLGVSGARPAPPHPPAVGLTEAEYHLRRQGLPILTGVDHAGVRGGIVRPIVEPTPLYPWSLALRRTAVRDDGVLAVIKTAKSLARAERWLQPPGDAWLPLPERGRRETAGASIA